MSGVELRRPCRLEVRLQKPLAERGHWEDTTKLRFNLNSIIRQTKMININDKYFFSEFEANLPSGKLMGPV